MIGRLRYVDKRMMKKERLLLILCGLFCGAAVAQPRLPTPPNMIVILAIIRVLEGVRLTEVEVPAEDIAFK